MRVEKKIEKEKSFSAAAHPWPIVDERHAVLNLFWGPRKERKKERRKKKHLHCTLFIMFFLDKFQLRRSNFDGLSQFALSMHHCIAFSCCVFDRLPAVPAGRNRVHQAGLSVRQGERRPLHRALSLPQLVQRGQWFRREMKFWTPDKEKDVLCTVLFYCLSWFREVSDLDGRWNFELLLSFRLDKK